MSTPAPAAQDRARREAALQREWWLRVPLALQAPRSVFRALRSDSDESAAARQEPALLLTILSGIAAVMSFSGATATLLDNPERDGLVVAVVCFLGGALYGFAGYWLGGLALHMGVRGAKGEGSYRLSRHLLAYALTPLAASLLVVWPIRLVAFGGANFRTGGGDDGAAEWIFTGIELAFLAWSLGLLLVALREVHRFSAVRSLGALLLAAMALGALGLAALSLGAGL